MKTISVNPMVLNSICFYKMLHVSALAGHHLVQINKKELWHKNQPDTP